ncbi:MAG TPA: ABC transporter substrate-binding protein [Thermoleophilaceae bacterium]|nr:ABC transporter substrate-binding protein [Thermoleophilaceae bacterium]
MRAVAAAGAAIALAAASGCGGQAASGGGGVVAFEPFAAETLVALGVEPAAVPRLGDPPPALRGLPTISVDHSAGPDMERLVSLAPDRVLSSPRWSSFHEAIQDQGIEVHSFDPRSIDELSRQTLLLGGLVGRRERARRLVVRYRSAVRQARERAPTAKPDVLLLFGTVQGTLAFLPGTYAADLVRAVGGRVASDRLRESGEFAGFAPISLEEVVRRDPDVIIAMTHGAEGADSTIAERLAAQPAWRDLEAVQAGRVHVTDADLFVASPGPRLPGALRELHRLVHR